MSESIASVAATIRRILSTVTNPNATGDQSVYIAAAIARSLAARFDLPTSPVASIAIHFSTTFDDVLCRVISEFNECLVLDTRLTRDLTYKFYQLRYDLVYTPMAFERTMPIIAACLPEYFPQVVCDVFAAEVKRADATDYYNSWSMLVNRITDGLQQVNATVQAVPVALV